MSDEDDYNALREKNISERKALVSIFRSQRNRQ